MQVNEINKGGSVINDIDSSLLNLYYAKENGYTFFNYNEAIQFLLNEYITNKDKGLKKKLFDYFSVFNDLNQIAGESIERFNGFDKKNKIAFFDKYIKFNGIDEMILVRENVEYPSTSVTFKCAKKYNWPVGNDIPVLLNKFYFLIAGSKISYNKQQNTFKNNPSKIIELFASLPEYYFNAGINISNIDLSLSFDIYVNTLEANTTAGQPTQISRAAVALIYIYLKEDGLPGITDVNKNIIAKKHGLGVTAGRKIKALFNEFLDEKNRLSDKHKPRYLKDRMSDIRKAYEEIDPKYSLAKQKALSDLNFFKSKNIITSLLKEF
ncbi:MAG TPA: hypothetical protein VGP43_02455 [Chitinophagaceae bacterium]|nr:hypothetical protein [Chitinophagaceae bacterium]